MENLSRKKQIEEMAKTMLSSDNQDATNALSLFFAEISEALYNAGYRKQSEGEWIFEHGFYGKMLCTNCKKEALTNEDNEYVDSGFCPNCGAKMRKEDEGK